MEGLEEFGAVAEEVITKTGTVLTNSYVNANGTTLALEGTEISLETAKNVHRFKWLKGAGKFLGLTMMMLSDTSSPNAASWNARQTVKSVDNLPGGTMTVTDVYSKGSEMPTEVTTYSLDRKLEVLPENMLSLEGPEDDENYEYFYRAMSIDEFVKTGGSLKHVSKSNGEHRTEGPFVTIDPTYLLNEKSFISKKGHIQNYDVLVQYRLPKGKTSYLENISIDHKELNTVKRAISESRPIKKWKRTLFMVDTVRVEHLVFQALMVTYILTRILKEFEFLV